MPEACQLGRTGDQKHPIDGLGGERALELARRPAAREQFQVFDRVRCGQGLSRHIGIQADVVPQGGEPARDPVGHVPGLAPDPVRGEARAEHRDPLGRARDRLGPDHAARSCRSP